MVTRVRNYLKEKVAWSKGTDPNYPYEAELDGERLLIRVNDFPAESLYTLIVSNSDVSDFDDWPKEWIRPGDKEHAGPEISVLLPVYNEENKIASLQAALSESLKTMGRSYEIIYVDDGSTDNSLQRLRQIAANDTRVRVLALRRNFGQTAAMSAGIDHARGQILIPMDADLQNDPADIRRLLEKLDEGYDVVSGWRKDRKDQLISRKIPSQIANRIISWIGGVHLHDYGCSLKAYRREVI